MTLRVVLVAFEFPPLASSGVHRALGFVRELPRHDIELVVVTVRPEDYTTWSKAPHDPALMERIPSNVVVHRIASGFPDWYWSLASQRVGRAATHYLQLGDPVARFWRKPLQAQFETLIPQFSPHVLLVTAPPFGVAALGHLLARQYRMPWVVDFRDPWTQWGVVPFPTFAHYWYARQIEGQALEHANVAVATSAVTRDQWMAAWPQVSPDRLVTIYNGYDAPDDDAADAPDGGFSTGATSCRRIVHTGNFYYTPEARAAMLEPKWRQRPHRWLHYRPRREDWLYRSPYFFLRGVHQFARTSPALAQRLRVIFAGTIPSWLPDMLRETETEPYVTLLGPVPYAESLRLQRGADALLLTSAKVEGGRDYSVAGKLIEYFGARRPILGVLTDGAMRDLLRPSGLGLLADPDDPVAISRMLAQVVNASSRVPLISPDETYLRTFERRATMRQMAACLRSAAAEGYRA